MTSFKSGSMALTDVSEYIEETKNIIVQSVSMAERDTTEDTAKLLEQEDKRQPCPAWHEMSSVGGVQHRTKTGKCNISKIEGQRAHKVAGRKLKRCL